MCLFSDCCFNPESRHAQNTNSIELPRGGGGGARQAHYTLWNGMEYGMEYGMT